MDENIVAEEQVQQVALQSEPQTNEVVSQEVVASAVTVGVDVDKTLYDAEEFLANFAGLRLENDQLKRSNEELQQQLEKARHDLQQMQLEKSSLEAVLIKEREQHKEALWKVKSEFQKIQEERLQWKEKYLNICMRNGNTTEPIQPGRKRKLLTAENENEEFYTNLAATFGLAGQEEQPERSNTRIDLPPLEIPPQPPGPDANFNQVPDLISPLSILSDAGIDSPTIGNHGATIELDNGSYTVVLESGQQSTNPLDLYMTTGYSQISDVYPSENPLDYDTISTLEKAHDRSLLELPSEALQLDISQQDLLSFIFKPDDDYEDCKESLAHRLEIIERFSQRYGNLSPVVLLERIDVAAVICKKQSLRNRKRRDYARLNSYGHSPDNGETSSDSSSEEEKDDSGNVCETCFVEFHTDTELTDHRRVCRARNMNSCSNIKAPNPTICGLYNCPDCSFSYRSQKALTNHYLCHKNPNKAHVCRVCGITFRDLRKLEFHQSTHER